MRLWSISHRRALDRILALSIVLILAASCAAPFRDYEGPELPDDQIVILKWGGVCCTNPVVDAIDGRATNLNGLFIDGQFPQTSARLLPGEHTINYSITFICNMGNFCYALRNTARLDLKAGHVYAVKGSRCGFECFFSITRKSRAWIEDEATGEVLHGSKTYE